jgi:hypothetical protein
VAVLTNIGAAFDQGEALIRACDEVATSANFRVGQVDKALEAHLGRHPELAPTATLAIATAPLQAAPAGTFPVGPALGIAAGIAFLVAVL